MRALGDPARRAAFEAESQVLCWQAARTACILSALLVPVFGFLDLVVFPEHAAFFLRLRLGSVVVTGGILWLLLRPFGQRHPLGLGVAIASTIGLMVDVMALTTGAESSPYYAGTCLVLVVVALIMPWPPRWTLFTACLLIGAYVIPIVADGEVADGRMLISNLFFLVSTAVVAVVSTTLGERLRWREFAGRAALVEALRHKGDFMARMSHELRTPIHVMVGYADILLDDGLAPGQVEARGLVRQIREHGLVLHRLISDLLDYAKVEAGKMGVRRDEVGVAALVDELAARFRPLATRKGLALHAEADPGLPVLVSDRHRLEQILTNLIGNAIKFTDGGAITLGARAGCTDDGRVFRDLDSGDGVRETTGAVAILVTDTGIGIRPEDVARLSRDFEQVDEAASARYGGTGLGLSIARKLVERLGGRIGVRSRYGEGSTFAVFLPAGAVAGGARDATAASPGPPSRRRVVGQ
jgi:signal transduction histidine kinase